MRSIVTTALFLLIGSGAVAQSAQPALPEIGFVELQPSPMQPMAAARSTMYSESADAGGAADLLPSAPMPAMAAAVTSSVVVTPRPSTGFKKFSTNKVNRGLLVTEFWARGLDAYSTRKDLSNPCGCFHETSRFMGMNMAPVFKTGPGAYSYSLGIGAAYSLLSAKLWDESRVHPHHARLLRTMSRALLVGDSSMEINADAHNFSLAKPVTVAN